MYILGEKKQTWYIFLNSARIWGKSQVLFCNTFKLKHLYYTEDQLCIFISSPIIRGNMKPKIGRVFLMVFLWLGWYSNFVCCFVTLELTEENFLNTFISEPILKLKHLIHIFIHQIRKEAINHHGMASPLHTSFSCTKDTQDKHNVPGLQNKVLFL